MSCPSTNEWIKMMWCVCVCMCVCVYTHIYIRRMEYYLAIKTNEILPFATMWMELKGIMLSQISQRKTHII